MKNQTHTSHLKLKKNDIPKQFIVCGDPSRAEYISGLLDSAKPLQKNREYHSYAGLFRGKNIGVISHGVGAPGAAICFQELIDCGVENIVRVGTAGALYDHHKIGDLVIATGAVRKDGLSHQMIPAEYPALADLPLTQKLSSASKKLNIPFHSGIILTSDLFYTSLLDSSLELYSRAGVLAVEMECSALFVIAQLRKIQAAAILATDGNPLKWHQGHYQPDSDAVRRALTLAIQVALETLTS